jgi:anti-sigma factor RsiW
MRTDPVSAFELDAYLDGELDLPRRLAVEEHLARHPEAAARVLADLSLRTALRLAQEPVGAVPPALEEAAQRLGRRLGRRLASRSPLAGWRLPIAAAVLGVAALGGSLLGRPTPRTAPAQAAAPAFVADAVMSYRTGLLRVAMPSQPESLLFDPGDIRRYTSIRVPTLPDGWRVRDVQVFPSGEGPALQLMVRTPDGRTVSVFAVRSPQYAPARPTTIRRAGASVAYWRHGDMAYALTGLQRPEALDVAAEDLADNRLD